MILELQEQRQVVHTSSSQVYAGQGSYPGVARGLWPRIDPAAYTGASRLGVPGRLPDESADRVRDRSWVRPERSSPRGLWGTLIAIPSVAGETQSRILGPSNQSTDRSYHGTKRETHQTDLAAAPPTTVGGAGRLLDCCSRFRT